jgi:hypothetical protein
MPAAPHQQGNVMWEWAQILGCSTFLRRPGHLNYFFKNPKFLAILFLQSKLISWPGQREMEWNWGIISLALGLLKLQLPDPISEYAVAVKN